MIIELLNGTKYDIENYNLKRLSHNIPSAVIEHETATIEGYHDIITRSKINNRVITVELLYTTYDIHDYYLLREQINDLFLREEAFYIIFKRENYKRWLVKTEGQFELPAHPFMNSFTVSFITINPFAESVVDTDNVKKEWDIDIWSWNNSIKWDEDLQYTFKTNTFTIKNVGNVPIDPRINSLDITLTGEFDSKITIKNITTNDIYEYNGALTSSDTLLLTGVKTLKNNVSVFKDTNKKLITLGVGENDFVIEGGTVTNIDFNFRFLYK